VRNTLLNILFPETCPICQRPASDHTTAPVCTECWLSIIPYTGPACRKCGRPLTSDASIICGDCLHDEPAFSSCRSFGLYEGALRKAINLLKYHRVQRLSKPLADILLHIKIPRIDAVLPVPLYKKRLRQREFNQSALIAKYSAEGLGSLLVTDALVKMRDTRPQVGLSSDERRKNMRNAFGVQNYMAIQGKDILLIDDVSTTGATIRECSRVLKKAGAGDIHVLTLAHGMRE
jgi:competence protein ComFC